MRGISQVAKLPATRAEVRLTRAFGSGTVRQGRCRREGGLEVAVREQRRRRMEHENREGETERDDMRTANTMHVRDVCGRCEGVQGVLTLFCSGAAQVVCHALRVEELSGQLEVEEKDGDRQEEEEEIGSGEGESRRVRHVYDRG